MAQVPKDIQENLKKLSETKKTPIKNLLGRLKEIMETNENIQAMENEDFKIRFAWAMLYKEYAAGSGEDFYVMPTICPTPRNIKTKKGEMMWIGELSALVQKINETDDGIETDDVEFAAGTFFRDGAEHLAKLEKGKAYRASLIAKETKWGKEISSDRANFAPVDYKFPTTLEQFYKDEIEPKGLDITLGEIDLHKAEVPTDIRILTVTAFDGDVGESADGREYGWYDFMDDSIMGSNIRMFFHPKDIEYAQGSILKVGVKVDINPKTDEPMISPYFILPTDIAVKKTFNVKPVSPKKQETVDISEEPEEEAVEEKKEEKPEAPKKEPKEEKKPEPKKEEDSDEEVSFEV